MKSKRFYRIWKDLERIGVIPSDSMVDALVSVMRLERRHQRFAEMACNGVGYYKGVTWYAGKIDDYARKEYGAGVQSAYITEDSTVFDQASADVEKKIRALVYPHSVHADFQGDPRGYTVRLTVMNHGNIQDISEMVFA